MSRSRSTTVAMPGRCTLTTTSVPSGSRAACTWATEAAASGSRSISAKTSSTGRPSSAARTAATSVPRHRRGLVLQRGQLVDELGRQQVAPGGQLLAELDERDAALVQRLAQRPGQLPPGRGRGRPALRPAAQEPAEPVPQRDPHDRRVAAGPRRRGAGRLATAPPDPAASRSAGAPRGSPGRPWRAGRTRSPPPAANRNASPPLDRGRIRSGASAARIGEVANSASTAASNVRTRPQPYAEQAPDDAANTSTVTTMMGTNSTTENVCSTTTDAIRPGRSAIIDSRDQVSAGARTRHPDPGTLAATLGRRTPRLSLGPRAARSPADPEGSGGRTTPRDQRGRRTCRPDRTQRGVHLDTRLGRPPHRPGACRTAGHPAVHRWLRAAPTRRTSRGWSPG